MKFFKFLPILILWCSVSAVSAQTKKSDDETVMVLPFENVTGRPEYNWIGESFAGALSDLMRIPGVDSVSNEERKIIQQRLNISLSSLPSLAASLKMAQEGRATILVTGKYETIQPSEAGASISVSVTAKAIRVSDGRFLADATPDGKKMLRDVVLSDAVRNLQTMQGQIAYALLYQRFKDGLVYSEKQFTEEANKVPSVAFEAYVKGLAAADSGEQNREGYFKNAIRIYAEEKAGKIYPDAALELGHLYLEQRRFKEALDYFARIDTAEPSYAEAAFYSGLIYWRQADFEQALAVMRPLADDLGITAVFNTLGAISVHASRIDKKNKGRGSALMNEGLGYLSKAVKATPNDFDSRFNYGFGLFLEGDFSAAAEQLKVASDLRPSDGDTLFLLAKSLEEIKDAKASDVDNQSRKLLTDADRYAKLQTEWSRSRQTDLINVKVLLPLRKDFLGVVMVKRSAPRDQGPRSESEKMIAKAKDLLAQNQNEEAAEILKRVILGEPMSAEGYYLLGVIHIRKGEPDQALDRLRTAIFWDNRILEAYLPLVRIFIRRGDCQQAETYFKSALEISPDSADLATLKRDLDRCSR